MNEIEPDGVVDEEPLDFDVVVPELLPHAVAATQAATKIAARRV
jgi:hypothetical protein